MPEPTILIWAKAMQLLSTAVSGAYGWAESAIGRARTRTEQRAAYILRNAGCLVAALRTLDNRLHGTMEELRLFSPAWSDERRAQTIERINKFAGQEVILPVVRQSVTELEELQQEATREVEDLGVAKEIGELLECGRTILVAVGERESQVTPWKDPETLEAFLDKVKDAKTPEDVASVRQALEEALGVLDRNILADADEAFGRIKYRVLRRHPSLPDPGWVVDLENIKPSSAAAAAL